MDKKDEYLENNSNNLWDSKQGTASDILEEDDDENSTIRTFTQSFETSNYLPLFPCSKLTRLCAYFIDTALLTIILFSTLHLILTRFEVNLFPTNFVNLILNNINLNFNTYTLQIFLIFPAWLFYTSLLNLLYGTFLEASPLRGTFGKYVFSLFIVDKNGNRCSLKLAFCRNFLKIFSITPLFLGCLLALTNKTSSPLHDIPFNCHIYKKKQKLNFLQEITLPASFLLFSVIFVAYFLDIHSFEKNYKAHTISLEQFKATSIQDIKKPLQTTEESLPHLKNTQKQTITDKKSHQEEEVKNKNKTSLGKFGGFTYKNKSIPINDVFVRINNKNKNNQNISISIFLFEKPLTIQDKQILEFVVEDKKNKQKQLEQKSLMDITLTYDALAMFCDSNSIIKKHLRTSPYVLNTLISDSNTRSEIAKSLNHDITKLNTSCDSLETGKEFSMYAINNGPDFSTDPHFYYGFNFSTKLHTKKSIKGLAFISSKYSIALYQQSTGILTLAQFNNELNESDINRIKRYKYIATHGLSSAPEVIVSIPLKTTSNSKDITLEQSLLKKNYTITFFNRPNDKFKFQSDNSYSITKDIKDSVFSINGTISEGKELSIHLSGEKQVESKIFYFPLFWDLYLTPKVIIVK